MYGYTVPGDMTDDERERLILEHLPAGTADRPAIQERLPDSISLDDLVSNGVLGLISAIDNFDPAHNVKLKTYAEYKIRGAILDSLRGLDWAPRQKRRKSKQIEAAIAIAEQRLKGSPPEDEIAAQLGITLEEYHGWLVEIRGLNLASLEYVGNDQGKDLPALSARHWRKPPFRAAGTCGTGENCWPPASITFQKSRRPCSASTTTRN